MAIGDLIRVTVNQDLQSSQIQNVLYYEVLEDNTSVGNEVALGTIFASNVIASQWAPIVVPAVQFTCLQVQKVFPLPIGAVRDIQVALPGTKIGESLPAMDSALIQKFNPAVGGKGKKGRVYIAGFPESDQEFGRIKATAFVELGDLAQGLQLVLETTPDGDFRPAWAVKSTTSPFPIVSFVEATNFVALPRFATQRRRRTPIAATS